MRWTKLKITALAVVGLLLLGTLFKTTPRLTHVTRPADPPFHFTRSGSGNELSSGSGADLRGLADFTSNIPVIILRADIPGPVSNSEQYSPFHLEVYEPGTNEPVRLEGVPTQTARVGLRLHGMVSRLFPKLSYRMKLQDEAGRNQSQPLLGMPKHADWVLQGPWLDKSLIRNAFSYDLARAMGCAAMRTRPCEVFLSTSGQPVTEADYLGVYQLTEHIERGEQRVNLAKLSPNETSEPAITGGYLLAWDVGRGNYLSKWKSIQVKYPSHPSRAQMDWIDDALTRFDLALKGRDSRDPTNGYAPHIEVEDWVNYILFEEFIFNLDGYTRSFYLQKDRGRGIRPGPVWDHDLALGHQFQNGTSFTQWWYTQAGRHGWIRRLVDDPGFMKKMAARWGELRKTVLSDEQVAARVEAFAAPLLPGAADRNFQRWRVLDVERPFPKPNDYITIKSDTYPEQITALKAFLRERAAWMDEQLEERKP
jgi:hypothetical protein